MAETAGASKHRIPFEPALDGLRGIGMLATLCFHSQFPWAIGSFLAISMFFTLSGYLITVLFLVEWGMVWITSRSKGIATALAASKTRSRSFWVTSFVFSATIP